MTTDGGRSLTSRLTADDMAALKVIAAYMRENVSSDGFVTRTQAVQFALFVAAEMVCGRNPFQPDEEVQNEQCNG